MKISYIQHDDPSDPKAMLQIEFDSAEQKEDFDRRLMDMLNQMAADNDALVISADGSKPIGITDTNLDYLIDKFINSKNFDLSAKLINRCIGG
jgi:hypothetical protein